MILLHPVCSGSVTTTIQCAAGALYPVTLGPFGSVVLLLLLGPCMDESVDDCESKGGFNTRQGSVSCQSRLCGNAICEIVSFW